MMNDQTTQILLDILGGVRTSVDNLAKEVHDLRVDLNTHQNQARNEFLATSRRLDILERQVPLLASQVAKLKDVGEVVDKIKKWATTLFAGGIVLAVTLLVVLVAGIEVKKFFG